MKSYRLECCRKLCEIWETLGNEVKDRVDSMVLSVEKIDASDRELAEFFKSTHMDSGVRILRLGLAELSSQVIILLYTNPHRYPEGLSQV